MKEVTVLIVDDSKSSYMILSKILSKTNFKVCDYAKNSKEAIEKYKEHNPDIVTMDMNLSGINGIETSRCILEMNPKAKIIMISAMKDSLLITKGREIGISSFLQKPVTPYELIDTLLLLYQSEDKTSDHIEEAYIKPFIKIFQHEIFQITNLESTMKFEENVLEESDISGTAAIVGLTGDIQGKAILYAEDAAVIGFARLMLQLDEADELDEDDAREAFSEAANVIMGKYVSYLDDVLKDQDVRMSPPGIIKGRNMKFLSVKLRPFDITASTSIGDIKISIGFSKGAK